MNRLRAIGRAVPPAGWTALGALVVGIYLTIGIWGSPGTREIAGNPHDTDLVTNWIQHTAASLAHGYNPFYLPTLNAPVGVNGMWNSSLIAPGIVLAPLTLTAGSLVSYNVIIVASITATAGGGHLLMRRFVARDVAAAAAALVWAFSPAVLGANVGHIQFASFGLVPFILLAADDVVRGARDARRAGVRLGLVSAVQFLTGEEVLFQTVLFTALLLVVLGLRLGRAAGPHLRRAAVGAAFALIAFLVLDGYPLWVQFGGPLVQHGTPFPGDFFVADLRTFVTPPGLYLLATSGDAHFAAGAPGGVPEYLDYLGIPLILAALATAVRLGRRPLVLALAVPSLIFAVASLGGHLLVDRDSTHIHLPWSWVNELPILDAALANRFGLFVTFGVGALAGLGLDALLSSRVRRAPWIAGAIAAAVAATLLPAPYDTASATDVPAFFHHATDVLPRGTTALVEPYPTPFDTSAMRWQSAANLSFAMPGGYFSGPDHAGVARISGPNVKLPTVRLLAAVESSGTVPYVGDGERSQLRSDLDAWHATAIVVGPMAHRDQVVQTVTALTGTPPTMNGGVAVWRV